MKKFFDSAFCLTRGGTIPYQIIDLVVFNQWRTRATTEGLPDAISLSFNIARLTIIRRE